MKKHYYEGPILKVWRGSWGPTFKFWRGCWSPTFKLWRGTRGPGVLVPLLYHANVKTNRIVSTKWTCHKEWSFFASNYFIFWKFCFRLGTCYKDLLWCTNDSNVHIHNLRHKCNTSATWVRHEQHECDTSATHVLHERHVCDTSVTRTTRARHEWKILILITTRIKTYFYTLIFTIWQMKDYKERNNFILRTTFRKCLISIPKCV